MVGKSDRFYDLLFAAGAEAGEELTRTRNAAERNRLLCFTAAIDGHVPAHAPNLLVIERSFQRLRQYKRMSAAQRRQRFAQSPYRKQRVFQIAGLEQDDIKIAVQAAMLKSIVEQVKFGREVFFRQQASLIAVRAYDHRNLESLGDQQRLVAELLWRAGGINDCGFSRGAAITAGKHIKGYSTLTEQSSQRDDKRRLSTPPDGDVSNAHYRTRKAARFQELTIIERIPDRHA